MLKKIHVLLCVIILLFFSGCAGKNNNSKSRSNKTLDAINLVKDMGIGVNIGNTLDCIGTNYWRAGETGWGNPEITQDYIKALKKYGYKTIRLPVTWAENIDDAPDYTIDSDWMYRVDEVVNWILGEDMYCIVNLHHDGGDADRSWIKKISKDADGTIDKFTKVWTQIAENFSNAGDLLIFEAMNEVGFSGNVYFNLINKLNQTFVNTVRSAGGNNKMRFLLISGYNTDINNTIDARFTMPEDTQDGKLIVSIHYYTPSTFCISDDPGNSWGYREKWGTPASFNADINELNNLFNKLKNRFLNNGIPVIIGEYGVTVNNKEEESRVRWIYQVTKKCLEMGMCPVLWETGLGTGGDIEREEPFEMSGALSQVWDQIRKDYP